MSERAVKGRVRLAIDFPNPSAMLDWFERLRDQGAFGTEEEPATADEWPEEHRPQRPRSDIGVRAMDAIDTSKIGGGNLFIVSGTRDGGAFLQMEHSETSRAVLKTGGES